ncbi:MAG: hypothetical protein QOD72_334 [Acidimicrobiaceae bacterium]|nr:hypothetical protein [Acidimicrobiaceae bacterium]
MFTRSKKLVAGVLVGAAVVGVGGLAMALWTSTGTGSGNAKALAAVNITVTAATGAADLYPGFTQGDVFFTSANTNPYPVTFASMTSGTVTSSDQTNCPAANVTVGTASGLSLLVPAGATAQAGTIANVVTMSASAPDGCQGVVFTIALTLSGSQS